VGPVSNQQYYHTLKPLPVPEEHYKLLAKAISLIALGVLVTSFFTTFGLGLALFEVGFSVQNGVIGGAVVGVAASIFFGYIVPIPSKVCQYRVKTLEDVYGQIGKDERLENKVMGLKNFMNYPLDRFKQTFHNHMLHNALVDVGKKVLESQREDIKTVWKAFLEHLNHTKVINADGEEIELNFSSELERLEGQQREFLFSGIGPQNVDELEQIEALQRVAFGKRYTFTKELLSQELSKEGSGCIVSRKKGDKQVVGFGWYHTEKGVVTIGGIAIDPSVTGCKIGEEMLHRILSHLHESKPTVQLQVRKSNPAQYLYQKWGFEVKKELPNYCQQDPPEDSLLMELKWESIERYMQRLGSAA